MKKLFAFAFLACCLTAFQGCSNSNNPVSPDLSSQESGSYKTQNWIPNTCLIDAQFTGTPGSEILNWTKTDCTAVIGADGNSARITQTDVSTIPWRVSHFSTALGNANLFYYNRVRILVPNSSNNVQWGISIRDENSTEVHYVTVADKVLGYIDVVIPLAARKQFTKPMFLNIALYGGEDEFIELGDAFVYRDGNPNIYWDEPFSDASLGNHPEGWLDKDANSSTRENSNYAYAFNTDIFLLGDGTAKIETISQSNYSWGKASSPFIPVDTSKFTKLSVDFISNPCKIYLWERNTPYRYQELTNPTIIGNTYTYDLSSISFLSSASIISIEFVLASIGDGGMHSTTIDNVRLLK